MEHTDKSIQEANNKIREGTYLVGEFESDGDSDESSSDFEAEDLDD